MKKCKACDREVEKVFRYRIEATYDMGMSDGGETYEFAACNDDEAKKYLEELEGGWLDINKRGVHFSMETFSRVIE